MNILITGNSKGIGRELTEWFTQIGEDVYGMSRNIVPSTDLVKGDRYHHSLIDVTDEDAVTYFFKTHPPMDVIINNAGIASMNSILTTPIETVRRIMDTNYVGTYLVSREAVKRMNTGSRIINFSSVAVPMSLQGEAAYVASKAAIEALTKVMAKEFAPMGITVNCIGIPPVDTDLIKGVDPAKIALIVARLAIQRKCKVEDIIHLIEFLISPDSDYITGQVIYLGGCV